MVDSWITLSPSSSPMAGSTLNKTTLISWRKAPARRRRYYLYQLPLQQINSALKIFNESEIMQFALVQSYPLTRSTRQVGNLGESERVFKLWFGIGFLNYILYYCMGLHRLWAKVDKSISCVLGSSCSSCFILVISGSN